MLDKLFILYSFISSLWLIPLTLIGAGGVPHPLPVIVLIMLPIPRYKRIAATIFAVTVATIVTTSICPSFNKNLAALIIVCWWTPSISSWTTQKPGNWLGSKALYGWKTFSFPKESI